MILHYLLDLGMFDASTTFDGDEVLGALQIWWQHTAGVNDLTADGKLWCGPVPQGVTLPYASFLLDSQARDTYTTGFGWTDSSVAIGLYASTPAAARALAKIFRQSVKGAPLSIAGTPVAHVLPNGSALELGKGLGPGGQDCWIATETVDIRSSQ